MAIVWRDAPGAELGRFTLERRLGAGAMGVVYQALDRERGVRIALKTLRSGDPGQLARLKREFRALQDLEHPNLVSLGELFEQDGRWFFTMELVDGEELLHHVRPGAATPFAPTWPEGTPDPDTPAAAAGGAFFDEARLRSVARQLALGLHALHQTRRVHRDVKPGNVRVTPEGRAVLLDFGLVSVPLRSSADTGTVGSAAYMAPEQAVTRHVGPAADWYSFGVVLYEALTGHLPFEGPPLQVLMYKQQYEADPPRSLCPDVPEDLDHLCRDLLQYEPAARPDGEEVLRRLGAVAEGAAAAVSRSTLSSEGSVFIGREAELAELRRAFDDARADDAVTVYVRGESGIGKSELLAQFAERIRDEHPDTVVLAGRCYERESVPYKALDGIVEELARLMMQLPGDQAAELVPRGASLLPRMFPALARVEVIARAPHRLGELRDPHELRRRSFRALRELLVLLAERRPVVLAVDDLQWADIDSIRLLADLLRPPEAPPLLALVSARTPGPASPELPLGSLPGDVREIALGALPASTSRQLATRLLRQAGVGRGFDAELIAREAKGHPLYIDELIRYAAIDKTRRPERPQLDEAIWARILTLPDAPRRVVELIAVAGVPLPQETVRRAAELPVLDFSRAVALLRVVNLVRTGGGGDEARIEPYHDRVVEAVIGHLDADDRRARHARLAVALELEPTSDPELLATHLVAAGQRHRASTDFARAARMAAAALAFDRAARLFRVALEHGNPAPPERSALCEELGDALANAGRGVEAASAYQAASAGCSNARALDLRCRWSSQLLYSGHIDEGLDALEDVLASVGMRMARTPRRALVHIGAHRARLAIRGFRFQARDEADIPPAQLRKLDVMFAAAEGLGFADTVRGFDFHGRSLLYALKIGEPRRVTRAIATEAGFASLGGTRSRRRTGRLLELLGELTEQLGDPRSRAVAIGITGIAAFNLGDWRRCLELCGRAEDIFRTECVGVRFELGTAQLYQCYSLTFLGRIAEAKARYPRFVQEAEERGDRFTLTNLRASMSPYVCLAFDDIDSAERGLAEAMSAWSSRGFHLPHANALRAQAALDVYRGRPDAAFERMEASWSRVRRSLLLRSQLMRALLWHTRGAAAAAAAAHTGDRSPLSIARRAARVLDREDTPYARAMSQSLRVAIAAVEGRHDDTPAMLGEVERLASHAALALHAICARRARGVVIGGDQGARLRDAADDELRDQGILAPGPFARMMMPAVG